MNFTESFGQFGRAFACQFKVVGFVQLQTVNCSEILVFVIQIRFFGSRMVTTLKLKLLQPYGFVDTFSPERPWCCSGPK